MIETNHYMVDFHLPIRLTEAFIDLIPDQRSAIEVLFEDEVLVNYALSMESGRLWATFKAQSIEEVTSIVELLPLTHLMTYTITPLTFMGNVEQGVPQFSLN